MPQDRTARAAVVRCIREHPGLSRADVADRLALSRSTVTRIVTQLILDGLAVEGEAISSGAAGRRATALTINTRTFELVGVEVSGSTATCALVNLEGATLHTTSASLPKNGGQEAVDVLLDLIDQVTRTAAVSGSTVRAVGIGAPGTIDVASGSIVWAPSLGWRDLPLRRLAEDYLHIPTFVENDVRLAAIGEQWIGNAAWTETMAYLYVGEGVGSGVIVDGQLLRGHHNTAGEVGYLLPSRGLVGRDHRDVGAMESVATTSGLARRLRKRCAQARCDDPLLRHVDAFDQLPISAVLAAGDTDISRRLKSEFLDHVTMIITGIATVVDPEVVVLGGDLAGADPAVYDLLRARLASATPTPPDLRPGRLGVEAGVVGASVHALLEVEDLYVGRAGVPVA